MGKSTVRVAVPNMTRSIRSEGGLVDAIHRLHNLLEVATVEFPEEDIVSNSVITHILDR